MQRIGALSSKPPPMAIQPWKPVVRREVNATNSAPGGRRLVQVPAGLNAANSGGAWQMQFLEAEVELV